MDKNKLEILYNELKKNKVNINNIIYSFNSLQTDKEIGFYSFLFPYIEFKEAPINYVAAVYFSQKRGKFIVLYNPYLMGLLNNKEIIAIIKHEFSHIFLEHVRNRSKIKKDPIISNISMDILINGYRQKPFIKNLPGTGKNGKKHILSGIFIDDVEENYKIKVEPNKDTYEKIYEKIINSRIYKEEKKENKFLKNIEENMDNEQKINEILKRLKDKENPIDQKLKDKKHNEVILQKAIETLLNIPLIERIIIQHNETEELENQETIDEKTKNLSLKEILRNTMEKAKEAGVLSSDLEKIYIKINEELRPKINWQTVIRRIVIKNDESLGNELIYNFNRPNLIVDFPEAMGHLYENNPKIGVVLDVSGSMSNHQLSFLLNELRNLLKDQEEVELVQIDTEIKNIQKIKRANLVKGIERKGIGGTEIGKGVEYFLKKGIFYIIIITDGKIEEYFKFPVPEEANLIFLIPENEELYFNINSLPNKPIILKI